MNCDVPVAVHVVEILNSLLSPRRELERLPYIHIFASGPVFP